MMKNKHTEEEIKALVIAEFQKETKDNLTLFRQLVLENRSNAEYFEMETEEGLFWVEHKSLIKLLNGLIFN